MLLIDNVIIVRVNTKSIISRVQGDSSTTREGNHHYYVGAYCKVKVRRINTYLSNFVANDDSTGGVWLVVMVFMTFEYLWPLVAGDQSIEASCQLLSLSQGGTI